MRITHSQFKVVEWKVDQYLFSGKQSFLLPVEPDFGAGHIVGAKKLDGEMMPLIILGVQWSYELFQKNVSKKSILKYLVHDTYWASIVERNNDKKDIINMVKDSYKRTKDEFDKRLATFNSPYKLHDLEDEHLDLVTQEIMGALKEKGV